MHGLDRSEKLMKVHIQSKWTAEIHRVFSVNGGATDMLRLGLMDVFTAILRCSVLASALGINTSKSNLPAWVG